MKKMFARMLALWLIGIVVFTQIPLSALAEQAQAQPVENVSFSSLEKAQSSSDDITNKSDTFPEVIDSSNKSITHDSGEPPEKLSASEKINSLSKVHVIVENTTYPKANGAPWDGTLVDTWVDINRTSTMMNCVVSALETVNATQEGAEKNYISEINGLKQFDGGGQSGWMGTINDWFTNEGFGAFTVADGKLEAQDEIKILYTCNYGEDLGVSWGNSDKKLKDISFSQGELSPVFESSIKEYTLNLTEDISEIKVSPTATNKNFQVRTSINGVEYKRSESVPVQEGTVIIVKCGDPVWPGSNDTPAEEYKFTVSMQAQEDDILTADSLKITEINEDQSIGNEIQLTYDSTTKTFSGELSPYTHLKQYNAKGLSLKLINLPVDTSAIFKAEDKTYRFLNSKAATGSDNIISEFGEYKFSVEITAKSGAKQKYPIVLTKKNLIGNLSSCIFIGNKTKLDNIPFLHGEPEGTIFQLNKDGSETRKAGLAANCYLYNVYISDSSTHIKPRRAFDFKGSIQGRPVLYVDGNEWITGSPTIIALAMMFTNKMPVPLEKKETKIELVITSKTDSKQQIRYTFNVKKCSPAAGEPPKINSAVITSPTKYTGDTFSPEKDTHSFTVPYTTRKVAFEFTAGDEISLYAGSEALENKLVKQANGKFVYALPVNQNNNFAADIFKIIAVKGEGNDKLSNKYTFQIKFDTHAQIDNAVLISPQKYEGGKFSPDQEITSYLVEKNADSATLEFSAQDGIELYHTEQKPENKINKNADGKYLYTFDIKSDTDILGKVQSIIAVQKTDFGTLVTNYEFDFVFRTSYNPNYPSEGWSYDVNGVKTDLTFRELNKLKGGITGWNFYVPVGKFGSSIVVKYDSPITDDPNNPFGIDFMIYGNAFAYNNAGVGEPAGVSVSEDGITWYTLACSRHYEDQTDWARPYGSSGLTSVLLAKAGENGIKDTAPEVFFGGADIHKCSGNDNGDGRYPVTGRAGNPYSSTHVTNIGDGFDLAWAVDANGKPVSLKNGIKYIKIQNVVDINHPSYGLCNAEICTIVRAVNDNQNVGVTDEPKNISVNGTNIELKSGAYEYKAFVKDDFDVKVDVPEDTNVAINNTLSKEASFKKIPLHKTIRIIVQQEAKQPLIYYITLTDKTDSNLASTGAYIYGLVKNPVVSSIGGEWAVIGLARSEYKVSNEYYAKYIANVISTLKETNGILDQDKYTEYSRVVLALSAIGYDVTDVGGYNLLKPLADYDQVVRQGINGPIWALIALDSHNYEIPSAPLGKKQTSRDNLIESILDKEISGGGWALSGSVPDPDITCMVLQAIAPYYNINDKVKTAVDRGLTKLSEIQDISGGFKSWGSINCESCAQAITALTSLGINPETDKRFIKNGKTVIDALNDFYSPDGGFKHISNSGVNGMATEQAYYALVSYSRLISGKTSLYNMNDVKPYDTISGAISLIDCIGTVTLDKAAPIKTARIFYDALKPEQKVKVTNYSMLTSAERALKNLNSPDPKGETKHIDERANTKVVILDLIKYLVDKKSADVIQKITDMPKEAAYDEKSAIEAYKMYITLTDKQKAQIINFSDLEAILNRIGIKNHSDTATNLVLEGVDWNIGLKVKPKAESDSIYTQICRNIGSNTLLQLWDITLIDQLSGNEYHPNSEVTLRVPAPDISNYDHAVIAHYTDDGRIEYINCEIVNGELVWQASNFSHYAVIGCAAESQLILNETSDKISPADTDEITTAENNSSVIRLWIAIAGIGFAMLIFAIYIKTSNKL